MHIYLIGYRGSGKSTAGRALARALSWPMVDTDDAIEAAAGMTIREIFEREQEAGFRDREERAVRAASERPHATVIALGGGAILREANQQTLRRTGRVVWLRSEPATLFQRVSGDAATNARRPDLSAHGGYAEIVEVLAAREPLYRQLAELIVETDGRNPVEIEAQIATWVQPRVGRADAAQGFADGSDVDG